MAQPIYDLHAIVLGICILVAVVVFGLMFYSLLRHRQSIGRETKHFDDNKAVQLVWTLVPLLIVVGLACPATRKALAMKDTSNPGVAIKIAGYQRMGRHECLDKDITFYSELSKAKQMVGTGSMPDLARACGPESFHSRSRPEVVRDSSSD